MSSVSTPWPAEHLVLRLAEVVADRADHADVGEEARRQREVHGGAAERALALAEGRLDRVEGDRSDDQSGHMAAGRLGPSGVRLAPPMRAVQIEEFGGPEVLQVVDLPKPEPGDGEVLIEVARAGMNFADTHQRENSYLAKLRAPARARRRGGGHHRATARAWWRSCAQRRLRRVRGRARAAARFPIPDGVDDGAALALLIQGLTAWHLFRTEREAGRGRVSRRGLAARAGSATWPCSSPSRSARGA